ncbi:efflux RND transporter permease subunit [Aestuariivirga sp. YIM B02566]|uniref:Efflux RND transporter permease subunit n=1 Tax=Taklimakanibacter albus TaxID=2800327 RepID=A0ACC5R9B7_9HYPH|nr:efflux RND transporter permease subunit [Aestuariivirga sp. YIM B02566]MBK1869065.1 efflux RND transporter permease subunit [Aestuariivirga sp. YIM B02566]
MSLSELCIRRPVFATVLSLIILLIGIVAYGRLTVREYPQVDEPVVSVNTTYTGASAVLIESQITQVLEGSLAGIEGIDIIESTSRSESSRITIRFKSDIDIDTAASDVRDRVSRVRGRLPDEVDEPIIAKVEADAQAIIYITFRSDRLNAIELTDYVDRYVVDRFKNLTGISDAAIYGERLYAMRIWLDRDRLAGYGLTAQDIEDALRKQNAEIPAGRIESADREFTVLSKTALATPEEFRNIMLKPAGGLQVKLGDVARVELSSTDVRRISRYMGQTSITVGIIKQAVANPLDVSKAVREVMPSIIDSLPDGVNAEIGYDSTQFIEQSVNSVFSTILEAIALVILIIMFFLHSLRAAIIPIITIPISLVATFAIMLMAGLSINMLTLLAMVLAIGLVVDDAIVVLENIFRHVEEGMKPFDAALKGMREIGFAVVAMTLTLAAVYAPIAFMPGSTGRLFLEFALTLAGAVVISGFIALTLTPMMCSKLLKHNDRPNIIARFIETILARLERAYHGLLTFAIKLRYVVFLIALGVAGMGGVLFTGLNSELTPSEDRGVLQISGQTPEGSTLAFTNRYAGQVEGILAKSPDIRSYLVTVGQPEVNEFFSIGRLKDYSERNLTQSQIAQRLGPELRKVAGAQVSARSSGGFGRRGGGRPVEFVIQTSGTYEDLQKYSDAMLDKLAENPGLTDLDSNLKLNKPQLEVKIDRDRVADLGLDVSVIGRTLETMLGGRQVTRFEIGGEQYDVIVQLDPSERSAPDNLARMFVRNSAGEMIQLSNIVSIHETVAPKDLRRFNQLRAVTLQANLAPGYTLGQALQAVQATAEQILPSTALTDVSGQSREFRDASSNILFIFVLALAFIYLVLSAQFESFRDPLMIMLTVPLSMAGALLALKLTGGTLNIYSQIGLVTLVGLITKHGILIVDFANRLQEEGKSRGEAIVEAATLRLRPILMTTAAMVLGAVPLALAEGAGAEARQQIGWVIVGGMSVGTLLTLFVVPAVYSLAGRKVTIAPKDVAHAAPAPAE